MIIWLPIITIMAVIEFAMQYIFHLEAKQTAIQVEAQSE